MGKCTEKKNPVPFIATSSLDFQTSSVFCNVHAASQPFKTAMVMKCRYSPSIPKTHDAEKQSGESPNPGLWQFRGYSSSCAMMSTLVLMICTCYWVRNKCTLITLTKVPSQIYKSPKLNINSGRQPPDGMNQQIRASQRTESCNQLPPRASTALNVNPISHQVHHRATLPSENPGNQRAFLNPKRHHL